MAYESPMSGGRNGFWQILRSEWTKFWSVPAAWLLVIGPLLVGGLFLLDLHSGRPGKSFGYHLTGRTLTGDGTITARVLGHDLGHPAGALAGIIMTSGDEALSPYTALFVTPDRGTWMHSPRVERRGSTQAATPRWLRLTRQGGTVTGSESSDGTTWQPIGRITLRDLPGGLEVGLVVSGGFPGTVGSARFDHVTVAGSVSGAWQFRDIGTPGMSGGLTEADGVLTMRGYGNFPPLAAIKFHNSGIADMAGVGILLMLPLVVAVGVLTISSEYARGTIRTTLAASPRRGRVLAAKAIVLGGTVALLGLALAAFEMVWTWWHTEELGIRSFWLLDPWVVGVVYGTPLVLCGLALLGLAAGTFARDTLKGMLAAGAVVLGPPALALALPDPVGTWLGRLSPLFAGLAPVGTNDELRTIPEPTTPEMQRLVGRDLGTDFHNTFFGVDYLPAWAGLVILGAWVALAFVPAHRRLQRNDA